MTYKSLSTVIRGILNEESIEAELVDMHPEQEVADETPTPADIVSKKYLRKAQIKHKIIDNA